MCEDDASNAGSYGIKGGGVGKASVVAGETEGIVKSSLAAVRGEERL